MGPATLGIDLGTSSTKAVLVGPDGRVLASAGAPHASAGDPARVGRIAVDAWWRSVVDAVRQVQAGHDADVAAVGLSGQMHGIVLLDRHHRPVADAVTWVDTRSAPLVDEVATLAGDDRRALANPVVAGMAALSLRWMARHEPRLLEGCHTVVQPKDWLGAELTGRAVTDPTDASATLLWDMPGGCWHRPFVERLGLDAGWLPPVAPSDAVRGELSAPAAGLLGLPPGLPVTVGRADTAAALVGSGVAARPALAQLSLGTGGQICKVVGTPRVDPTLRTHLYAGPGPDQWYAMAATLSAGLATGWVRRLLGLTWQELHDEAFSVSPGAGGVVYLPYLAGERTPHLDPTLSSAWAGLRLEHGRAEMLRAVVEGSALALRDAWDALTAAGHDAEVHVLAGGGTVDPRTRQLLADVLDRPLAAPPGGSGSARGAALSAGVVAGWFDDVGAASASVGEPVVVCEPGPDRARYDDVRARFRALVPLARRAGGGA